MAVSVIADQSLREVEKKLNHKKKVEIFSGWRFKERESMDWVFCDNKYRLPIDYSVVTVAEVPKKPPIANLLPIRKHRKQTDHMVLIKIEKELRDYKFNFGSWLPHLF